MPSSGGSSNPVTNKTADNHFAYVRWDEAVLQAPHVITPTTPGEKVDTPEDQIRRSLNVSEWTPGLTLLYFHTPHEELDKSKLVGAAGATFRQCKSFNNDQVLRWLAVYHCVEVDMSKSDVKVAERLGFKDGAIFAVIDQNLNVLATSKPVPESESVKSFLKNTIKSDTCKTWWDPVQKQMDEQKKKLQEARALAAKDQWKEAAEKYKELLNSNIRIAEFWDDAAKEATKVARKASEK